MPTYEYACKECSEHLEVVQSFRDDALTICPSCGGALRKVFGAIGIAFKGSGFYRTDSRDTSSAAKTKNDSKSDAKDKPKGDSSGGTSKTDSAGKSSASSSSTSSPASSGSKSGSGGSSAGKGDSKAAASS